MMIVDCCASAEVAIRLIVDFLGGSDMLWGEIRGQC